MAKSKVQHFLTGDELTREKLLALIARASEFKKHRRENITHKNLLPGKQLAMIFEKQSLRSRVSFTVAMNELGGNAIEILASNRKKEEPEDTARVLEGYCHAIMGRVFAQNTLERMAAKANIPIINGLSDLHHPCQALADLLTLQETFSTFTGLEFAYVGDGNNVLHSLLLLLPFVGVKVRYACPEGYDPSAFIVKKARTRAQSGGGSIEAFRDPAEAVRGANAIYTDVWTSMGAEHEMSERDTAFEGYQVNEALLAQAKSDAIVLHCLPMIRGKEISEAIPDHPQSALFRQSENRLHVQKALLCHLLA